MKKEIIIAVALSALLFSFFGGYRVAANKYSIEISEMRAAALSAQLSHAAAAAEQMKKTIQIERDLNIGKKKVEEQHAKEKKRAAALLAENRRLVADLGGMRDPGARACDNAVPESDTATGVDHGAVTGARLSDEAAEFLLDFAAAADKVTGQLKSCQAWILEVQEKIGFSDRAESADLKVDEG